MGPYPIDFPTSFSSRSFDDHAGAVAQHIHDKRPQFGLIEVLESRTLWVLSSGKGIFTEVKPSQELPSLSFIIEKNRAEQSILVDIVSSRLQQDLRQLIPLTPSPCGSLIVALEILLQSYDILREHLHLLLRHAPTSYLTTELQLLLDDAMLKPSLFDGFTPSHTQWLTALNAEYGHAARHRAVGSILSEYEACLWRTLPSEDAETRQFRAYNHHMVRFALNGDLTSLREMFEPLIRRQEIRVEYDSTFLEDILDGGSLEIFKYVLEMVERTSRLRSVLRNHYAHKKITYHPLYVAIRLGHMNAVAQLVGEGLYFEGSAPDQDLPGPDFVFTPLLAAAWWRRPAIYDLLLKAGSLYQAGLHKAQTLAMAGQFADLHQVLPNDGVSTRIQYSPLPFSTSTTPEYAPLEQPVGYKSFSAPPEDTRAATSVSDSSHNLKRFPHDALAEGIYGAHGPQQAQLDQTMGITGLQSGQAFALDEFGVLVPWSQDIVQPGHSVVTSRCTCRFLSAKVEEFLLTHPRDGDIDPSSVSSHAVELVKLGLKAWQDIMRNRAPQGLQEILACLLVAWALTYKFIEAGELIRSHFQQDLWQWRSLLTIDDQQSFDTVLSQCWQTDASVVPFEVADFFGDIASNQSTFLRGVVHTDAATSTPADRSHANESPMPALHHVAGNLHPADSKPDQASAIHNEYNIGSSASFVDSINDGTQDLISDMDLGDLIDLNAWRPETSEWINAMSASPESRTEVVDDQIVLSLVGTFAFCVIVASGFVGESPRESATTILCNQEMPAEAKALALLNDLIDANNGSSLRASCMTAGPGNGATPGSIIPKMKAAMSMMQPESTLSHSYDSTLPINPVKSGSSSVSQLSSSFSVDENLNSDRFHCLTPQCTKTFSSISNRNKHMRDGCILKENRGYPCRNNGCRKILTTKWYRNTHEHSRCRHRREHVRAA